MVIQNDLLLDYQKLGMFIGKALVMREVDEDESRMEFSNTRIFI